MGSAIGPGQGKGSGEIMGSQHSAFRNGGTNIPWNPTSAFFFSLPCSDVVFSVLSLFAFLILFHLVDSFLLRILITAARGERDTGRIGRYMESCLLLDLLHIRQGEGGYGVGIPAVIEAQARRDTEKMDGCMAEWAWAWIGAREESGYLPAFSEGGGGGGETVYPTVSTVRRTTYLIYLKNFPNCRMGWQRGTVPNQEKRNEGVPESINRDTEGRCKQVA